jgi:hypothetical protein
MIGIKRLHVAGLELRSKPGDVPPSHQFKASASLSGR